MEQVLVEVHRVYAEIWHPDTKFNIAEAKKLLATNNHKMIYEKLGLFGIMKNNFGLNEDLYISGCMRIGQSAMLLRSLDSRVLSRFITTLVEEIQKGEEFADVTCKKACSACCHQEIPVYIFEAAEIVNYLRKNPDAIDIKQLNKHVRWSARSSGDGNYGWGNSKDLNELRCPALSKEGLCNIYEVRPLACRNYVVKSHPSACDIRNEKKPLFMMHPDIGRLMVILMQFDGSKPMAHALRTINRALVRELVKP